MVHDSVVTALGQLNYEYSLYVRKQEKNGEEPLSFLEYIRSLF